MERNNLTIPQPNARSCLIALTLALASLLSGCRQDLFEKNIDATDLSDIASADAAMIETGFFKTNETLGGEVVIVNAKVDGKNGLPQKVFTIDAPTAGEYFLNAWANSPELLGNRAKNRFLSFDLTINGEKHPLPFNVKKSGWHNVSYIDGSGDRIKVVLQKGRNQIAFSSDGLVVPAIDFVRMGRNESQADIEEDKYLQFVADVKNQVLGGNGHGLGIDTTSNGLISPMAVEPPSNPLYDYEYRLNHTFLYTYYTSVYLNAGQQAFFTSTPGSSGNFKHVLEVFSSANPQSYSWTTSSSSIGVASLNINIPSTGTYYVKVRSYWQGVSGMVNLNINGQYYYPDCVASGSFGLRSPHYSNQTYNYFTVRSTGDPRIWIEDSYNILGRIIGYNDDYWGNGGDFYWNLNSRVKKQYNTSVGAVLVSAYSSYNPSGVTDLYFRNKNSNITGWFPNLKADDAIMSSPQSTTYNCTAWTGGFTSFWFWGSTPSYYYGSGFVWNTWDNYYGNNPERYAGAMAYTPVGANESNGIIAMWAKPNGEITHGSIRKPGNNHAHGYDWESKPGSLARTFHPRNALSGSSYGSIVKYYRQATSPSMLSLPTGGSQGLSFEESVAQGLTVVEPVELTGTEMAKMASRPATTSRNINNNLNTLYSRWMEKIKSDAYKPISNPYVFVETAEGQQLLSYAKNNLEDAVLFFASIIFDDQRGGEFEQNISHYMFWEVAKAQYGAIMENIKDDWKRNKYTKDGRYIVPLPETFTKKYIKQILNTL